jgi:hypothetical protein
LSWRTFVEKATPCDTGSLRHAVSSLCRIETMSAAVTPKPDGDVIWTYDKPLLGIKN